MDSKFRQVIFWVIMIGAALLLYNFFQASNSRSVENVALSQLITKVRDGEVAEATFETDQVVGTFTSNANAKFRCELANPTWPR